MENRDIRSLDTVTEEELAVLKEKKVTVIGAGGLGGYVIEMLSRIGVGHIQVLDGDVFDETNLNRQLYSREDNLGKSKVEEVIERIGAVRSDIEVTGIHERFNEETGADHLAGSDVVMDCVDNIESRLELVKICEDLKIPMVHGAVGAWSGQVMTLMPGDKHLDLLYDGMEAGPSRIGASSFIPANIASCQVAECIKLLTGKGELLTDRLKVIDLLANESFVVKMTGEEEE